MAVQAPKADRIRPPAYAAGSMDGELAPIIPLDPSPPEEGFLYDELSYRKLLSADPLSVVGGLWRGVNRIRSCMLGDGPEHSDPIPKRVFLPYNGHDHLFLVTDPAPEAGVNADEASNAVFKPGLTELADSGSALRLHVAYAKQHPDRRVITEATKGMSHTGKAVSGAEIAGRRIDTMAGESLYLLPRLTRDGAIEVNGTSLGTRSAVSMAEQNLAADHATQLNITRLTLIASAVVACKIEGSENFRDPDLDEDEYRQDLSKRFQVHIAEDFLRMARTHPVDILSCWPNIAAYVLAHPAKSYSRARAIAADYGNVKEGVPWSTLKQVASGVDIRILGGSRDPLIQEQEPQWAALDGLFPGQIKQSTIQGMGHLMSAAARDTVDHLARMDEEPAIVLPAAA
jgi:hypothetical protein